MIEKIKKMALEREELRKKLFKEHKVESNRKAIRCFSLAWEYGHSAGLHEVESYFDDLVELIK